MPAVKLHQSLIVALVGIMHKGHGVLPDGVAGAVDPGDEDEPASNPFPLNHRHFIAFPGSDSV